MEANEIPRQLIQRYWRTKDWKPTETFNLYVDSPFCAQQCRFCMLRSTYLPDISRHDFRDYYEALPLELLRWADVLWSHPIDTAYFGGGTSSLMTLEQMSRVFDAIPSFTKIENKCFECDPLSLSNAKLELLADRNFTYVTFGIQTLDVAELRRQNRVNPSPVRLRELTAHALGLGLHVSIDLMAFLNDDVAADVARVHDDLMFLLQEVRPTAVDLYPMVPKLENRVEEVKDKLVALRRSLTRVLNRCGGYQMPNEAHVLSVDRDSLAWEERYRNYFFINMDPNEYFSRIKRYSCSNVASAPESQNTIAFGGYGRRQAYSYADKKELVYYSCYRPELERFIYSGNSID